MTLFTHHDFSRVLTLPAGGRSRQLGEHLAGGGSCELAENSSGGRSCQLTEDPLEGCSGPAARGAAAGCPEPFDGIDIDDIVSGGECDEELEPGDEAVVQSISKLLMDRFGEKKSESERRKVSDVLKVPIPSPREVKRKVKCQRSTILTSSPTKRRLEEKEKNARPAKRQAKKRTGRMRKDSLNAKEAEDTCIFCGEGVRGQNELWLQCQTCENWCHDACSQGYSRAGFVCDFCR